MAATPSPPKEATYTPEPTAKEKSDAMAHAQMAGLFGSMADFLSQPSHRHWAGVGPAPKSGASRKDRDKKKSRKKMAKASRKKNR